MVEHAAAGERDRTVFFEANVAGNIELALAARGTKLQLGMDGAGQYETDDAIRVADHVVVANPNVERLR